MQIEEETKGKSSKDKSTFVDQKLIFIRSEEVLSSINYCISLNSFIEHFRRYVDPFYPSVPTPPPNFS